MQVLVTGATGFVGGALARALLATDAGERVRCLVRDPQRAGAARIPATACVAGRLDDLSSLRQAVRGVDLVYHVAGAVVGRRRRDYFRTNADGTANLLAVMRECAPEARLVHVSSLAAAGPSADGATSAWPPERCRPISVYGESKRQGELAVAAESRLRWVIVRPPVVYGPGDGATRLVFRQALARLTVVPPRPRPISAVHVDDLVDLLRHCAGGSAFGRVLPVAGPEDTDTHDLLRRIGAACGRRPRLLPVPLWVARGAALAADAWAALRRRPGYFSRDKLREIAAPGWVADPRPAADALGWRARIGLDQGLRQVAAAEGHAPPAGSRRPT